MKTRWMKNHEPSDEDIRDEILRLLMTLRKDETICATDAARQFGSKWRQHMPQVFEVAANMVRDGMIEITQRGEIVDVDERTLEAIRGPLRIKLIPPKQEPSLRLDDRPRSDDDRKDDDDLEDDDLEDDEDAEEA